MTFQELILALNKFWSDRGCVIQQPYDLEVGAGTFNPATFLRVLGPEPYKVAYVEHSRRPTDGRYALGRLVPRARCFVTNRAAGPRAPGFGPRTPGRRASIFIVARSPNRHDREPSSVR